MKQQELRMLRGIRTARRGTNILATLKSMSHLVQEDDPNFPNKVDRVLARDQIIREVVEALQMALAQAEGEI